MFFYKYFILFFHILQSVFFKLYFVDTLPNYFLHQSQKKHYLQTNMYIPLSYITNIKLSQNHIFINIKYKVIHYHPFTFQIVHLK